MNYATLLYDVDDDGVLTLTLNRPGKLNAFTVQMCEELVAAFALASTDDAVRVIVVTGAGRAFCAGMDLSGDGNAFGLNESLSPTLRDLEERSEDPLILNGVRDTGGRVALAMYECLKPIVGAVNGVAVGIGATILLPMDFRLASETARFGFVFGKLGITMEACSSWFLPRIVGVEQAMEWCFKGEIFDAQEALEKKLVRAVASADELLGQARTFALSLVQNRSAVSIALMRQMILCNSAEHHPLRAHQIESLAMFYTSIGDGREGVAAFRQKREPAFAAQASRMPPFFPWRAP